MLDAMEAEHHLIDPVLEQCADLFLRLTFDRDRTARRSLVRALERAVGRCSRTTSPTRSARRSR